MTTIGVITILRIDGRVHITQADENVLISTALVNQFRTEPTDWARADQETLTIGDESSTYTYRIAPHSPEMYAGHRTTAAPTGPEPRTDAAVGR